MFCVVLVTRTRFHARMFRLRSLGATGLVFSSAPILKGTSKKDDPTHIKANVQVNEEKNSWLELPLRHEKKCVTGGSHLIRTNKTKFDQILNEARITQQKWKCGFENRSTSIGQSSVSN